MQVVQGWNPVNVTVERKDGKPPVSGLSAAMYADAGGLPVFVQVKKADHFVNVPWHDVETITHA